MEEVEDEEKVLNTQAVEQTRDEDNVGNQPVSSPLRESQFMSQVNLNQNQQPPPEPNQMIREEIRDEDMNQETMRNNVQSMI